MWSTQQPKRKVLDLPSTHCLIQRGQGFWVEKTITDSEVLEAANSLIKANNRRKFTNRTQVVYEAKTSKLCFLDWPDIKEA